MKRICLTLLMQVVVYLAFAQYSLKGTVKNESGELLSGANLSLTNSFVKVSSDVRGFYEFKNLKAGNYEMSVSFMGYAKQTVQLKINSDLVHDVILQSADILAEEVLISANRIKDKTPVAYSTVDKAAIKENNMGQDIPYLLSLTPSFVSTSDGGTGVGYTSFRVRGTDMNRINVTLNGIPMNDAESHGTWWVDVPDLASSTDQIQVQRGVGTSTKGTAAFGASINLQTNTRDQEGFTE